MPNKSIGTNIAELRRERDIKQEELANAVGVSTQAVSKWECGGMPDAELLPAIADFFSVSVDRLFGRSVGDYGDLKAEVAKHIVSIEQEKRIDEVMEYCWVIEKAIGGSEDVERSIKDLYADYPSYSQMLTFNGITSFCQMKDLPYFIIMPEPEGGWEKGFLNREEYVAAFKALSDPDVLNVLFLLYRRDNKPFTPKLLEKELKLPLEKAEQILQTLMKFELISESEIELDDSVQKVFNFTPNPAFISLLAIAREFIHFPHSFSYYRGGRERPYLR